MAADRCSWLPIGVHGCRSVALRVGPGRPAVPFTRLRPAFDLPGSRRRRPAVPFTRLRPAFDLLGSRSVGGPQSPSLDYVPLSTCSALGASAARSPFHSIASRFRPARLSERRRPAVPFTRLRPAFDLPGSRSVGGPQSPSLDCVPLSTCPALGASAARSPLHSIASRFRLARLSERRRPAVPFTRLRPAFDLPGSRRRRPAATGGEGAEFLVTSFYASLDHVCLSTCPALGAGGPQLPAAKARSFLLQVSMLHLTTFLYRPARLSEPAGRSHRRRRPATLYRVCRPSLAAPENRPSIRLPRPRAVHLPPEQRPRPSPARESPRPSPAREHPCLPPENRPAHPPPENLPPPPATAAHPFFSTNHGNRSPPARPIFAVSGPAVRRPLSGKQSLGRPLPAAARRIVGRNYCRRHSRPPASSLRRPAGIFPKPTSRIAPLAALADGSQASQAPATVTSALSEVRLKKPPRSIGRAPRRFPENSIPQPVTGPNRSFGPASACPYRRTAVPPNPGIPAPPQQPSLPPPSEGGVYNEKSDRRSIAFRVELPRFELGITGPESVVLPLHHSSMSFSVMQK